MYRALCAAVVVLTLALGLCAQTEQTLYTFSGYADGGSPSSNLVMDAAGNLYGTTITGGQYEAGEVYELTPIGNGGWTQTVLYSFTGKADGANPYYADVIFDKAGNLYGTTIGGGANHEGVVFELTPTGGGWTETVLYSFAGGTDGANPYAGLLFDPFGNLYGTTYGGGANGVGTVFQLRHGSNGHWAEKVIHTFDITTGSNPVGGLVFDRKGDLFGTTQGGGASSAGVVFELQYAGNYTWTGEAIHSFTGGADGGSPYAERLIFDKSGNLYGTTRYGGINNAGVVFKMSQFGSFWGEQTLYEFNGAVESDPYGGVIMNANGTLFGTCANGNGTTTFGSIFRLTPSGAGKPE